MRIGYEDIEEIKQHPWFEGIEWSTIRTSKVPYNPPQLRRPARLIKTKTSSSFSNIPNQKSPLLPEQISPSVS